MEDNALICLAICVFTLMFFVLRYLSVKNTHFPDTIGEIKDEHQRTKKNSLHAINKVAIFFSVSSSIYSFVLLHKTGLDIEKKNSQEELLVICFSIGYFISDIASGIIYEYIDNDFIFHHLASALSFYYAVHKGLYGSIIVFSIAVSEAITSILTLRDMLLVYKKYQLIGNILGLIFCVCFIYTRIVTFGQLGFFVFRSTMPLITKLFYGMLWYLSLYWSFSVFNLATKSLRDNLKYESIVKFYSLLSKFRKNKVVKGLMHCVFISLSFTTTLTHWNHVGLV